MKKINSKNTTPKARGSHGGARAGAGRKALPGQAFKVRITHQEFLDHLEKVPDAGLEIATFATKCFIEGQTVD